ncbi:hypothetical protein JMJ35_009172 [Cladonia borealis]|uniref:Uncharacterized protein n=1 Tax=Cladonia borealis TaxID=184061 RepID=A0AA39QUQ6_9LECA|nr:hypothetical protein JMJ35_009172 [Cladonia borealis]
MPGLMDMPSEIRYQILELCLLVEGTINPYPALHEDKDQFAKCNRKPDLALLKVNKVLNFVATRIFYKRNTWQLGSPRPLELPPFQNQKDLMWEFHRDRILRLRIRMDMYDLPPNTVLEAARKANERSLGGQQRTTFVHDDSLKDTRATIFWKMVMIYYIKPLTVEVDMKDMFCPVGCCRNDLIQDSGRKIRSLIHFSNELPQSSTRRRGQTTDLSVVGLAKGEEQTLIREIWKQESEDGPDEVSFSAAPKVTIQWYYCWGRAGNEPRTTAYAQASVVETRSCGRRTSG